MDVEAERLIFCHASSRDIDRAVSGVVENLDLQKLQRISNVARGFDQPFHDIHFVVDRKLYRHARLRFEFRSGLRDLVFVFQVEINEMVSVNTIDGENRQDREIRNQNKNIEGGKLVELVPTIERMKLIKMCLLRWENHRQR